MMTPERVDELERLANRTSPSPWSYGGIESVGGGNIYDRTVVIAHVEWDPIPAEIDTRIRRVRPGWEADANGEFIAASKAAVLDLCAALRQAWAERDAALGK